MFYFVTSCLYFSWLSCPLIPQIQYFQRHTCMHTGHTLFNFAVIRLNVALKPILYWHRGNLQDCSSITHTNFPYFTQWWRHQMETFSALLALCEGNSPITGDFPSPRPVMRSFDLHLNKRLSKPSRRRWFEMPSHSLWRHYNVICNLVILISTFVEINNKCSYQYY